MSTKVGVWIFWRLSTREFMLNQNLRSHSFSCCQYFLPPTGEVAGRLCFESCLCVSVCSQRGSPHVIIVYLLILVYLGPLPDPSPLPGSHMGNTPPPPAMDGPSGYIETCSLGDLLPRICLNLFTWGHLPLDILKLVHLVSFIAAKW